MCDATAMYLNHKKGKGSHVKLHTQAEQPELPRAHLHTTGSNIVSDPLTFAHKRREGHAHLTLLMRAGQAGSAQGTPSAQQAEPNSFACNAEHSTAGLLTINSSSLRRTCIHSAQARYLMHLQLFSHVRSPYLTLLVRARQAKFAQRTPGAQQAEPHSSACDAQQAKQQHCPVDAAVIILHNNKEEAWVSASERMHLASKRKYHVCINFA